MEFNSVEWHDCVLKDIQIDRSNPGHKDSVKLVIITKTQKKLNILFEDVFHADLKMNFNVIAEETIRSAEVNDTDEFLLVLKQKWKAFGTRVNKLKHFEINTNSTNSIIKIYALNCYIEKVS